MSVYDYKDEPEPGQEGRAVRSGVNVSVSDIGIGEVITSTTKEVSDLSLASYLSISGWKLVGMKSAGKRLTFLFDGGFGYDQDVMAFYNHAASVDPLTYSEAMRNMKSIIYQQKKG